MSNSKLKGERLASISFIVLLITSIFFIGSIVLAIFLGGIFNYILSVLSILFVLVLGVFCYGIYHMMRAEEARQRRLNGPNFKGDINKVKENITKGFTDETRRKSRPSSNRNPK